MQSASSSVYHTDTISNSNNYTKELVIPLSIAIDIFLVVLPIMQALKCWSEIDTLDEEKRAYGTEKKRKDELVHACRGIIPTIFKIPKGMHIPLAVATHIECLTVCITRIYAVDLI